MQAGIEVTEYEPKRAVHDCTAGHCSEFDAAFDAGFQLGKETSFVALLAYLFAGILGGTFMTVVVIGLFH